MPLPAVTSSCFVNAAIWALASMSCDSRDDLVEVLLLGVTGTRGGITEGVKNVVG
jgi:hypothetical protein